MSEVLNKSELLALIQSLSSELFSSPIIIQEKSNLACLEIPLNEWAKVAHTLKNHSQLSFDMLCDHAAIDWPNEIEAKSCIELTYQLYSTQLRHSLMVSVKVQREKPLVQSVHSLWPIAEWQEREVYDLFGVQYLGHPDLRRLFLEEDWVGHPLLKDYKDPFMLERPW